MRSVPDTLRTQTSFSNSSMAFLSILSNMSQQILGGGDSGSLEGHQLFHGKASTSEDAGSVRESDASDDTTLHRQMRNLVLDIYNEGRERDDAAKTDDEDSTGTAKSDVIDGTGTAKSDVIDDAEASASSLATSPYPLATTGAYSYPQTEELERPSYDVALNAAVDLATSSASSSPLSSSPLTVRTAASGSLSSLPESLRDEANRESKTLTPPTRRKLTYSESERSGGDGDDDVDFVRKSSSNVSVVSPVLGPLPAPFSSSAALPPLPSVPSPFASPSRLDMRAVRERARAAAQQLHAVKMERAHLSGKLQSIAGEYSRAMEEKARLQAALASSQANVEVTQKTNERLKRRERDLEGIVLKYQRDLTGAEKRVEELSADEAKRTIAVKKLTGRVTHLEQALETTKLQSESKQKRVHDLERELESSRRDVVERDRDATRLLNELSTAQRRNESLESSRNCLETRIEELLSGQQEVRQECDALRNQLIDERLRGEQIRSEIVESRARLTGVQEERIAEKRRLMTTLEEIASQWTDHKRALERSREEKESVEETLEIARRSAGEETRKLEDFVRELELELEATSKHLKEHVDALERLKRDETEGRLSLRERESELRGDVEREREKARGLETALGRAEEEIGLLKARLEKQRKIHGEAEESSLISVRRLEEKLNDERMRWDVEREGYEKRAIEAEESRRRIEDEMREKLRFFSQQLDRVGQEALAEKTELMNRLANLEKNSSKSDFQLREESARLKSKLSKLENERDRAKNELDRRDAEMSRTRDEFQQQLDRLRVLHESKELENEQKVESLSLALEVEKGKLCGLNEAHSSLKEHSLGLESTLLERNQALAKLSAQAVSAVEQREREEELTTLQMSELKSKVEVLVEERENEATVFEREKKNVDRLREDVERLKAALLNAESTNEELSKSNRDIFHEVEELRKRLRESEDLLRDKSSALEKLTIEHVSLENRLSVQQAEQAILADKAESLIWQLEQKRVEQESTERAMELAEERHRVELETMDRDAKARHGELSDELAQLRLQSDAAELGELQLRSDAETRRREASRMRDRNERLEMANDQLRQTASSLVDQYLKSRRTWGSNRGDEETEGIAGNIQVCLQSLK